MPEPKEEIIKFCLLCWIIGQLGDKTKAKIKQYLEEKEV